MFCRNWIEITVYCKRSAFGMPKKRVLLIELAQCEWTDVGSSTLILSQTVNAVAPTIDANDDDDCDDDDNDNDSKAFFLHSSRFKQALNLSSIPHAYVRKLNQNHFHLFPSLKAQHFYDTPSLSRSPCVCVRVYVCMREKASCVVWMYCIKHCCSITS